jgi:hypothetical protein
MVAAAESDGASRHRSAVRLDLDDERKRHEHDGKTTARPQNRPDGRSRGQGAPRPAGSSEHVIEPGRELGVPVADQEPEAKNSTYCLAGCEQHPVSGLQVGRLTWQRRTATW